MLKKLKWFWYRFRYDNASLFNKPVHLDLEINRSCNCKCPACYRQNANWIKKIPDDIFMPFSKAEWFMEQARKNGFMSIKFNWRGEPTCDMELLESCAEYANKIGFVDRMINTNGINRLSEKAIDNLTSVAFSIDSALPEKYKRLRPQGNLPEVLGNLSFAAAFCHGDVIVQRMSSPANEETFEDWKKRILEYIINCRRVPPANIARMKFREFPQEDRTSKTKINLALLMTPNNCLMPGQRLTIGAEGKAFVCPAAYYEPDDLAHGYVGAAGSYLKSEHVYTFSGFKETLKSQKAFFGTNARSCLICKAQKERKQKQ